MGLVYDALGIYFLIRAFCLTKIDVVRLCQITAALLVPLALGMLSETITGRNAFTALGALRETVLVRAGMIRAQGPFGHPILAGTVGAVCLPLSIALWRDHRKLAFAGAAASLMVVLTSGSSGPILSLTASVAALSLWPLRHHMTTVRRTALLVYIALALLMKAPAYYLIARIDLTGGSTGWHRARLLESAFEHFSEWWLFGTDYTRHWMASGVTWSADHTDITNHYIRLGVLGGAPLMLLFIALLVRAFCHVGDVVRVPGAPALRAHFLAWALGAALFSHAVSGFGVSYFDQSFAFLYTAIAAVTALGSGVAASHGVPITAGCLQAASQRTIHAH
jgi:hypothetical protein